MALDSSLFAAQIPAATYAVGDVIEMGCIRGPEVVRSGYGAAYLKKVFTNTNISTAIFKIEIKNSNWVDSISNVGTAMADTSLDENSVNIQRGHDCPLTPNSTWSVRLVCITAGTESAASMAFALIDVDYPSVAAIKNPRLEQGTPATIDLFKPVTITAMTAAPSTITWNVASYDFLKAGYRYLIDQVGISTVNAPIAFIEISGAAGQNGLTRIIPCRSNSNAGIRYLIDYATPLVKGPMNIGMAVIGTAGTATPYMYIDWVKR